MAATAAHFAVAPPGEAIGTDGGSEDWANAALGLDSASLRASSLAILALVDRVRHRRRSDFESQDGKLMTLFARSKILRPGAHPEDPRLKSARRMAEQIVAELRRD
jgi:hypothetical protein